MQSHTYHICWSSLQCAFSYETSYEPSPSYKGHIFLPLLLCVFSYVCTKSLMWRRQSCIDYISLVFHPYAVWCDTSELHSVWLHNCIWCICRIFLDCVFSCAPSIYFSQGLWSCNIHTVLCFLGCVFFIWFVIAQVSEHPKSQWLHFLRFSLQCVVFCLLWLFTWYFIFLVFEHV